MPPTSWRGLLLDADNTIFDYDRAAAEALSEALRELGIEAPPPVVATYRSINAAYWRRYEEGTLTLEELKRERFRDLLAGLGSDADPSSLSEAYLMRLGSKAYFLPHACRALEELARHVPIGLLTNGIASVQRQRLARSGVAGLFTAVLISSEIGIAKPDPRVFVRGARELGRRPEEVLVVGDSPAADIRGARAAGMAACWVAPVGAPWPGGEPAPDFRIADLRALPPLLREGRGPARSAGLPGIPRR